MPAYQNLVLWILTAMCQLQPPTGWGVKWGDTYESTAERFAQAALDDPLTGRDGPDVVFTAALMTVWAHDESHFRPDAVGDGGHSYGLLQVNPRTAARDARELLDPATGVPIALELFHFSFRACRAHPLDERMSQYAYGRDCEHRLGLSRARVERARALARTFSY